MPTITTPLMNPLYIVCADLTSSDICSLGSSPVEVIPAYGANTYINIVNVTACFTYNSVPFTGGSDILLYIGSNYDVMRVFYKSTITSTTTTISTSWSGAISTTSVPASWLLNQPLNIGLITPTSEFSGGDSTLGVCITYGIITI